METIWDLNLWRIISNWLMPKVYVPDKDFERTLNKTNYWVISKKFLWSAHKQTFRKLVVRKDEKKYEIFLIWPIFIHTCFFILILNVLLTFTVSLKNWFSKTEGDIFQVLCEPFFNWFRWQVFPGSYDHYWN